MAVKKLQKHARGRSQKKWKITRKQEKSIDESNNEPVVKTKHKKTLVITQEIKFARMLAGNDKNKRLKMLKKLRTWITVRAKSTFVFTETDFMRLWKGLFYCMWMSDKPLVQEELAESISQLIHCFESIDTALLYTKCALKTLSIEWFGIDHYRVDKFEMLVRRIVRQTFVMCKKRSWDEAWTKGVGKVIETVLLEPKGSLGFNLHITELYMEELAKISEGNIPEDMVTELMRPFAIHLAAMTDNRSIRHVMKHIFRYLIFQSDVGMDYMEKFQAWRQAGFPTGSIDAMQKVELSDEEDDENMSETECTEEMSNNRVLDPRAGKVDVELSQVPFNAQQIADLLQQYKFLPSSTTKTRRQVVRLVREFSELAKGTMPLGIKEVRIPHAKSAETNSKRAAQRLIEFEDELYEDTNRRLKRKKSKKLILNNIENNPANDDVFLEENVTKKPKFEHIDSEMTSKMGFSNGEEKKVVEKKELKKNMNLLNESKPTSASTIKKKSKEDETKLKIKSQKQSMKVKSKKIKTKKLDVIKASLTNELMDGIDDFADFKMDMTQPGMNKVKKIKKASSGNILLQKIPFLQPVLKKLEPEKLKTSAKIMILEESASNSKKRVKIVLQKNTAQATSEYIRQLRMSPAIPFDANRKPPAGVLKSTPLSSPINPFYKKL